MPVAPVTFTLDLEEHAPASPRAPRFTRAILEFLAAESVRATVFVVGELAAAHPDLVREIAGAGHELALHGWDHAPLTDLEPTRFAEQVARGKALLEDLGGSAVTGYRAPTFSLVPSTRWAADELAALGFAYSSSVLPARNPLFGYPGAPRAPFRWPSGLVELPVPVVGVGSAALPYLGGIYLRVLPPALTRAARRRAGAGTVLWTYCHPYDFDPDEPYERRPGVGAVANRLLWRNRDRMFDRMRSVLGPAGAPLGERVPGVAGGLVPD